MKLFFWSYYAPGWEWIHTWTSVQDSSKEPITLVFSKLQSPVRKEQGWSLIDLKGKFTVVLKDRGWWRQSLHILQQNPDAIHVFMGFKSHRIWLPLILFSIRRGIKTAILYEAYSTSPVGYNCDEPAYSANLKVLLRPFIYRATGIAIRLLSAKGNYPAIFPLSLLAKEQLIKLGFDRNSLFPFGYFVPRSGKNKKKVNNGQSIQRPLRLIFIGSLLIRKGLDVATFAIKLLKEKDIMVTLDIYGPGDPKKYIPRSLEEQCTYKGVLPGGTAQLVIPNYDALLLPSRHDGWGVVVNEALLQGVPTIVSNRVGAKCLIESSGAGLIFKNEDSHHLAYQLEELAKDSNKLSDLHKRALRVGDRILPSKAAAYFVDALDFHFFMHGKKPTLFWP